MSDLAQTAPEREEVSLEELAILNDHRAATYGMLARIYRKEVDAEYLAALRQGCFPAQTGNEHVDEGYRLIVTYLSRNGENCQRDLAVDYSRCFIGNGMNSFSCAYPYESVYTSAKRLLLQDARDEVLAVLRSEGFEKNPACKETEDHLALELEFMQVLCQRASKAMRAGDEDAALQIFETQRGFYLDHLVSWVPLFIADLKKFAQTDFFRGVASLTQGFLESEQDFFDSLLPQEGEEA